MQHRSSSRGSAATAAAATATATAAAAAAQPLHRRCAALTDGGILGNDLGEQLSLGAHVLRHQPVDAGHALRVVLPVYREDRGPDLLGRRGATPKHHGPAAAALRRVPSRGRKPALGRGRRALCHWVLAAAPAERGHLR